MGGKHTTMCTYSPPTLGAGHQQTVSTNTGCNQWLSVAKTLLKVALDGRNRSLVACTTKCGWAITLDATIRIKNSIVHGGMDVEYNKQTWERGKTFLGSKAIRIQKAYCSTIAGSSKNVSKNNKRKN